jgi:hypothetical protein
MVQLKPPFNYFKHEFPAAFAALEKSDIITPGYIMAMSQKEKNEEIRDLAFKQATEGLNIQEVTYFYLIYHHVGVQDEHNRQEQSRIDKENEEATRFSW